MSNLPILICNKSIISSFTMTSSTSSAVLDISEASGFFIQAVWTGTPVGNLIVEVSSDGNIFSTLTTQAVGGSAGSYILNEPEYHATYIRVRYSFSSSTGSLTVNFSAKRC